MSTARSRSTRTRCCYVVLAAMGSLTAACGDDDPKKTPDASAPAGGMDALVADGGLAETMPASLRDATSDDRPADAGTSPSLVDVALQPDTKPAYQEIRFPVPAFQVMPITTAPTLDGVLSEGEWDEGVLYPFAYNQLSESDQRPPSDPNDFHATWKVVYQKNRMYGTITRQDDVTITTNTTAYRNDSLELFIKYGNEFLQIRSIVNAQWDKAGYLSEANIVWSADGKVAEFMIQFPQDDVAGTFIGWNIAINDMDVTEDLGDRKYQMYPLYGLNQSWQGQDLSDLAFVSPSVAPPTVDASMTPPPADAAAPPSAIDGAVPPTTDDGGAPATIDATGTTREPPAPLLGTGLDFDAGMTTPTHSLPMPFLCAHALMTPVIDGTIGESEWSGGTVQSLAYNQLNQKNMVPPADQNDLRGDWKVLWMDNVIYGFVTRKDNTTITNSPNQAGNDMVEIFINYQNHVAQLRTIVGSDFIASGFVDATAVWSADGTALEFKLTLPTDTLGGQLAGWNISLADSDQAGAGLKSQLYAIPGNNDSWRGKGLGELRFAF